MSKKSKITLNVELDTNKVPEKIEWEATDAGFDGTKEALSMMLSLFDKDEKVTLGIDLWTKEMLVDDMNIHVHQTLLKMADTYGRATKNHEVADMIRDFSKEFADKVELNKKVNKK